PLAACGFGRKSSDGRKQRSPCRKAGQGRRPTVARPAKGQVVRTPAGRWAIRFRAYGKRHYVTTEATSQQQAQTELENVLADVRRGLWQPSVTAEPVAPQDDPTFHEFASEWLH